MTRSKIGCTIPPEFSTLGSLTIRPLSTSWEKDWRKLPSCHSQTTANGPCAHVLQPWLKTTVLQPALMFWWWISYGWSQTGSHWALLNPTNSRSSQAFHLQWALAVFVQVGSCMLPLLSHPYPQSCKGYLPSYLLGTLHLCFCRTQRSVLPCYQVSLDLWTNVRLELG